MAESFQLHTGDGATTQFAWVKDFISRDHVVVYVDDVSTAFTWVNDNLIQISPAAANLAAIKIQRETPTTALVDFQTSGSITEADLDAIARQGLFVSVEYEEQVGFAVTDAETAQAAAEAAQAAAELAETNAETAETGAGVAKTAAEAAQTAAETAQTGAQTAETGAGVAKTGAEAAETGAVAAQGAAVAAQGAAETAQTAAELAETNAETAETGAGAAQTAAEAAQAAAEAVYDSFDDRYLGAKAADPALDNDGNALIDGALYFNTTTNAMRVYDLGTTAWITAYFTGDTLGALGDVDTAGVSDGDVLTYVLSNGRWEPVAPASSGVTTFNGRSGVVSPLQADYDSFFLTPAEGNAAYAALSHNHATSDVTSGTFADARIAQTNVTQHQAALAITESQISDLGSYITASSADTLTNKTLTAAVLQDGLTIDTETANWTGTEALDPANGLLQEITLTGNVTTLTDSLADGESVILHIDDGSSRTISWPTITWVSGDGTAPTLQTSADTVITVWKAATTLYGFASNGA